MWMEEETSIEEKMKLIKQYELAGVASWRLGYERTFHLGCNFEVRELADKPPHILYRERMSAVFELEKRKWELFMSVLVLLWAVALTERGFLWQAGQLPGRRENGW